MLIPNVEKALGKLFTLKNDTIRNIQTDFMKHIVSVSVILLPLLALFPANLIVYKALFHSLLLSLSTCILTGVVHLYIVLIQHRKMAQDLNQEILRMLAELDPKQNDIPVKYGRISVVTEILCLFSFFTAIVLMVIIVW